MIKMSRKRECLDCDASLEGQPSYKTRCRRCYALHRNSLKMRECTVCGIREKREEWKKTCAGCYRKAKLAEKEAKVEPIVKVPKQPKLRRCDGLGGYDYDLEALDSWE